MKLLANAVAYLAVTSFAVLPNIAMSAEPAGGEVAASGSSFRG